MLNYRIEIATTVYVDVEIESDKELNQEELYTAALIQLQENGSEHLPPEVFEKDNTTLSNVEKQ
ncbi:hypothetical protein [Lactococcus fujiensis]|uniref:hypothetical protein n=1 Tax=Lactococcus fujiensis TaxID=610251 RepID=UPI0006CF807F|nr:hypothetical protein [Lactococcus fujiensis]